ncbi:MAG: ABC transporter ATP-binding protein [Planctomycetaceae bacterium]|nr:ABC transporter ATP-binding protein [Planctomycetaceae bacterium]
MLEATGLKKTFSRPGKVVVALDDVTLNVSAGEFAVVRGPSGSGKTTLLLTLGGLLAPDSGRINIAGGNPYDLSPESRAAFRAKTVGFVFQQFHLVPYLSVRDNVLCPALAVPADGLDARADELIARFNLAPRRTHLPCELSTGEKQRVALARALLNSPKLLLADEPTGNLDEANERVVLETFKAFTASGGAVLMVTHSRHWETHANRALYLEAGRLA